MEIQKKKCSLKEHSDINANIYCQKCDIYMCNKCEVYHSKLFENHNNFILDKNNEEVYNEFCEEETHHKLELKYFCKNHNKLCCAACLTKIKGKGDGQHSDCDVCCIEDIKEDKKNKVKDNIKLLEELSTQFNESFNDITKIYEKINENREKMKLKIQKIFTNLRNILNNREDELFLEIDKVNENLFFKDNFMKDIEKLPDKIKSSLNKCKIINEVNDQNEGNIYKLIKKCIEVENNINIINNINSNINNIKNFTNYEIKFIPEDNELNKFIEQIKSFGKIELFQIGIRNDNILKLSTIIKNDIDSIQLIINWIEETINKNGIKFKLIFRMSENGTNSDDFHKYCDNQGPTLILAKTTKNKIFGGFTPLDWKKKGGFIKDINNQTFIFSLNLKKKFNMIKKNGTGIYCSENEGPDFGASDFSFNSNMKVGQTWANKNCNFLQDNNLELTGEKGESKNFEAVELEVYKVIY